MLTVEMSIATVLPWTGSEHGYWGYRLMQRFLSGTSRTGRLLKTLYVLAAVLFCLGTVATGYAETTPGGSGRQPVVRPADVPSNSLPYTYLAGPTLTSANPATGLAAGGYSIVLTGTGFTGATAVTFGVTPATSFTVNSATQITTVVPAGTGTVQITVTTPIGTTNSIAFTYTTLPPPTLTSLNPASGLAAGGTTVILTGTGFTGATAVIFGGTPATSFSVNSATQITAVAPAGTGTVNVSVTTPLGTTNTLP